MSITLESIKGRTVLLKVAYDIPDMDSTERIAATLDTLHTLLVRNNKVLILTHWGRPQGHEANFSTSLLIPLIQKLYRKKFQTKLDISFLDHYRYFQKNNIRRLSRVLNLFKSSVIMLENTRFHPDEQSTDEYARSTLAAKYSLVGDVLVDEAFPVSHRQEVTNVELTNLIPYVHGSHYLLEKKYLDTLKKDFTRPYVLILGGAKLHTKIPLLEHLLPLVDHALIGGQAAFPFLQASGSNVSLGSYKGDSHSALVVKLISQYQEKILLPVDFTYNSDNQPLDIGEKTIQKFETVIKSAKTLFWNGPMGKYEDSQFAEGTKKIAAAIARLKNSYTVIGGGDTASILTPARRNKISFVSTGGGASLHYLSHN